MAPLLTPYWPRLLEIFVYILFGLGYALALPLGTKYLFDTILPSFNTTNLTYFILALFAIYALNMVVGMRRAYVSGWVNQRLLIALQQRVFSHLQQLSHNFYAAAKVGDIMSRLTNDIQMVQSAMAQVIITGIFMVFRAIAALIAMLILDIVLGAVVFLVVPLFAFGYFALRSRLQQVSYERQQRNGEAVSILQENLSAHPVVKAFGMEQRAISSFGAQLGALFDVSLRLITLGALFELSTAMAVTLGQLVVLGVGGYLVIQEQMTLGTLVAFIGLLPSLIQPVSTLSGIIQTVQRASGSMTRIQELLEEPVVIADRPDAVALPPLQEEIRLDNVTFGYGGPRPIIKSLDLRVRAGANVAIVGPSGAGKSTIAQLLLRFWDPAEGSVRFDGHDLRDVTLESLRRQIGIVFQDTFLFDTTMRENIATGRPDASDAEIVAAAEAAQLTEYIASLPNGYDTVLGERAVRMSGGQRQRLAIARAILRQPSVLILDEATSALDAHTERQILDSLQSFARGRTTISITHRLTSTGSMDRIFVLDQGRLVEQGTHAELVSAGGLYQQLYEEQTGARQPSSTDPTQSAAQRLRNIPLFAGLSDETLTSLVRRFRVEQFAANQEIVRQGEPGDVLYVVDRGQVEIVVRDLAGLERRINVLNPGDYFGEMALLSGEPRSATVRTTQPTQVESLSKADLWRLFDEAPAIRRAIDETVRSRRQALDAATTTAIAGVVEQHEPRPNSARPAKPATS